MSLGRFLFVLVSVWCTIHISHYLSSRRSSSILPVHNAVGSVPGASNVTLRGLQLRISTTKWNAHHDKVITYLTKRRNQRVTSFLVFVYNLGILIGALGMIFVILFCLCQVFWRRSAVDRSTTLSSNLFRRLVEDAVEYRAPSLPGRDRYPMVTPIIPGVTVPLNHLPIILVAVFIGQSIHELGHAAAAALESLPMTAAGATFTVCIPAAFVTFSSSGTNNLKRDARARVIAAGPFHNFAFWCILLLLVRLGLTNLSILVFGYKNVSAIGKVIVDVKTNSPLFLHLKPGSIVTQLDDTSLSSSTARQDQWTNYLSSEHAPSFGWCVDRNSLVTSDSCCDASSSSLRDASLTCFFSHNSSSVPTQGCIDPVAVFTNPIQDRCTTTTECASDSVCVSPHQDSQLLRVKVRPQASNDHESLVLWSGPPGEILEEVQVSNWHPRARFLPLQAPLVIQNFWEYLSMATLSLYLFNLLPLPYLDGTELIKELIDMVFEDGGDVFVYDLESLDHRAGAVNQRRKWKTRVMGLVHSTVALILTVYILFVIMNAWH